MSRNKSIKVQSLAGGNITGCLVSNIEATDATDAAQQLATHMNAESPMLVFGFTYSAKNGILTITAPSCFIGGMFQDYHYDCVKIEPAKKLVGFSRENKPAVPYKAAKK